MIQKKLRSFVQERAPGDFGATRNLPKARPIAGAGDTGSPELPTPATTPEGTGD
jgi:hypothetical protein